MAKTMLKTLFAATFAAAIMGGPAMAETAHDFAFEKLEGGKLPMSEYKGKAVLVVNTASFCGYTPQYEGLQSLWESYKDKGLVVLGFPCNDFGSQEPGTTAEIKQFCSSKFDVTFPLFDKLHVKGPEQHPLYDALTGSTSPVPGPVKWNFGKFLVSRDGKILSRFDSKVEPDSEELTKAIESALAAK